MGFFWAYNIHAPNVRAGNWETLYINPDYKPLIVLDYCLFIYIYAAWYWFCNKENSWTLLEPFMTKPWLFNLLVFSWESAIPCYLISSRQSTAILLWTKENVLFTGRAFTQAYIILMNHLKGEPWANNSWILCFNSRGQRCPLTP